MILEFSYPANPLIRWGYDLYFSKIMPWMGALIHPDKQSGIYLCNSVKHFIWGDTFCAHLRQQGFTEVRFKPLTFGIATVYRARK